MNHASNKTPDGSNRVQTVRNAWINRVRDEALRMRRAEVSKAVQIGILIARYADADGSNAYPSGATLGAIAGCTKETVTRCVRLLAAVGLLARKRRPNQSTVYQLVIPLERPDWGGHMDVWGESRQTAARRKAKEREAGERDTRQQAGDVADADGVPGRHPEGVPGGVSGSRPGTASEEGGMRPGTPPDSVPGRLPECVPGRTYQSLPTYGRDPDTDHEMAAVEPQPQVEPGPAGGKNPSPQEDTTPGIACCTSCQSRMILRPGKTPRSLCRNCEPGDGNPGGTMCPDLGPSRRRSSRAFPAAVPVTRFPGAWPASSAPAS